MCMGATLIKVDGKEACTNATKLTITTWTYLIQLYWSQTLYTLMPDLCSYYVGKSDCL